MPPDDVDQSVSARAKRAVGEHNAGDYILRPAEHAASLPPEAGGLKRILQRPEIETIRTNYVECDRDALRLQGRHMRWGKRGIVAAMLSAIVAVTLMVSPVQLAPLQTVIASSSVWLLLCGAWFYFVSMMIRRPLEAWYQARANAEEWRKRLFEAVLAADETMLADEIEVLPLQLEYFRRYQYDVQRQYFKGKTAVSERRARLSDAVGYLSSIVPFLALGLTVAATVSAAGEQGLITPFLTRFAGMVQRIETWSIDLYGIGAAIIVSAVSAGLFAFAQLDNYRRNAVRYANTLRRIEEMADDPRLGFPFARAAAAAGNRQSVANLVRQMHAVMTAEMAEWVTVGLQEKEIAMPERSQIPGAAYELRTGPNGSTDLVAASKLTPDDFAGIRKTAGVPLLVARKIGFVAARRAATEERIVTRWNGKESSDVAGPGDWVVTNMSAAREILRDSEGHENTYVIRAAKFPQLYDLDGEQTAFGQIYKSKSVVEAFRLPGSFEILAPWGEIQRGAQGYLINNGQEVYGNSCETFEATYEVVEQPRKYEATG